MQNADVILNNYDLKNAIDANTAKKLYDDCSNLSDAEIIYVWKKIPNLASDGITGMTNALHFHKVSGDRMVQILKSMP